MDNSPLGTLPPEIRDQIYAYALHFDEGISLNIGGQGPQLRSPKPSEYPLGLTKVCKKMREECLSTLYSRNIFRIRPYPGDPRDADMLEIWLKQIGPKNRSALQRVDMELGLWSPGYTRPSSATRFATPLPTQAAAYLTCLRDMDIETTFSIDVRYSDIPGLGIFHLSEADLVYEEKVFGSEDSKFEQACRQRYAMITDYSAESRIESYAVIRLIMGLDRCRNSFAEFLHSMKVQHRRAW